jgi:hypothetical protein
LGRLSAGRPHISTNPFGFQASLRDGVRGGESLAGGEKAVNGFETKPWDSGKETIIPEAWMLHNRFRDDDSDRPALELQSRHL